MDKAARVNRLEHANHPDDGDPAGLNPNPDYAFIDCVYSSGNSDMAQEYLMTPVLDFSQGIAGFSELSGRNLVVHRQRHLQCQGFADARPLTATVLMAPVSMMDTPDEVVKTIFSYDQDAIGSEDGEDPWYAERMFSVPEAVGHSDYYFAWYYDAYNAPWWAIDSIKGHWHRYYSAARGRR